MKERIDMKVRLALCFFVLSMFVTGPMFSQKVCAEASQSMEEEKSDAEEDQEKSKDEKAEEMLEILNEGMEGESADEFLNHMETAADQIMDLYEEDTFDEDSLFGKFLTWITDMVNRVFDLLLDFLDNADE